VQLAQASRRAIGNRARVSARPPSPSGSSPLAWTCSRPVEKVHTNHSSHPPAAVVFDGVPPDAVERSLRYLERRHFPSGTVVITEGDRVHGMYIVEAGTADVLVAERRGSAHHVNRGGPGDVLGEMSLFTRRPASATVRALEDLTVIVMSAAEFHELGDSFPRLYQNLGGIVSRKLYRADRLRLDTSPAGAIALKGGESEPLAGYGLAASLAWHVRAPVLLIAFRDSELPLAPFASIGTRAEGWLAAALEGGPFLAEPRAHVLLASDQACFAAEQLPHTLERLADCFKHVLLQGASFSACATRHVPTSAGSGIVTSRHCMRGCCRRRRRPDGRLDGLHGNWPA
jgi:CRP-like cAMP-binding protein